MVSSAKNLLGLGIYTPAEAARYARVQTQLMNRWLFGNKSGGAVIKPQISAQDESERIVTFLDFVQALAIRSIKENYKGVSLRSIRNAVDMARRKYGEEYPFARRHKTYLWVREEPGKRGEENEEPSCEIVLELGPEKHVQLTGEKKGNLVAKEAIELYLHDLAFNEAGIACEYFPVEKGGIKISMNPNRHFGDPLVPSGYAAQTLYDASIAEGSAEAAAKAYGVDVREVELACYYFSFLQAPVA